MAAAAAAPKVELTPNQSWNILKTLELLDHPAHENDKLTYTPISIKLGTSSGYWRWGTELYNSWTGGEETPNIEALPRLIEKVKDCITTNQTIIESQSERTKFSEQISKAVTGLESLKKNQYRDLSKKEIHIDKAIESLKSALPVFEQKRQEWIASQLHGSKTRSAEDSVQKEKDTRLAQLEEENKTLRAQLAATEVLGAPNFDGIPKEKLCAAIHLLVTYLEKKA
ncbi:MAG: hypothetical protein JSS10_00905 [Verrucomicrobia bacterium]|nr:hypothetical protein [Verrucomicrobiota bacterium]